MITRINARRLFAMAADGGKGGVFAQGRHTVVLGMIKIPAAHRAFLALSTNV